MKRFSLFCVLLVSSTTSLSSQTHWPLAPFNESHHLSKTYGDWNGFVVYQTPVEGYLGYHGGVDMPATFGTSVYAVEACSTRSHFPDSFPCGGDSGWICLSKTMLDYTAWHYGHIDSVPRELWIQPYGVAVADGQKIGVVAQFHIPELGDHLHFARTKAWYDTVNSYANPLAYLSPSPAQVPHIDPRFDVPHHSYKIYYVSDRAEDTTNHYETTYLRDSIDIIVKAHTEVQMDPRCGVYAIGYGVEPKTTGGNILFRRMFEMRDTIKVSDSLKYYLTYADPSTPPYVSQHFNNWYIVTNCGSSAPQPGYGLSNIQENCWPTKINIAGTADADSIEDARFPDGYYVTTIKAWSHSRDSVVVLDTVLVDNFNPRVKITYPTNYYHYIEKYEKEVWCTFSEAMDTATLIPANITMRSLVDTSHHYSIVNITYIDSLFKLVLEVDSFFFHDEVEAMKSKRGCQAALRIWSARAMNRDMARQSALPGQKWALMESVPTWHIRVLPDVIMATPGRMQSNCAKMAQFCGRVMDDYGKIHCDLRSLTPGTLLA
ncbi:hypothetical protein IBX73_09925 [candidate division WOR-3 bacterium]|nr:hypothetical protein [candidate division WOR-3 bacterium]